MPGVLLDQEPELREQLSLGCDYHPVASREEEDPNFYFDRAWQWHRSRRQAAIDEDHSLVELDATHEKVLAFQQALFDYHRNVHGESNCCEGDGCCDVAPSSLSPEAVVCCEDLRAERTSLEARLHELFDWAQEAGCIDLDNPTICDWSPLYFVESMRLSFGSAMESDYQRCLEVTGDDFEPLRGHEFSVEGSDWPGYPSEDYTATATSIDLYISRREEWLTAYRDALPLDLFDENGDPQTPAVIRAPALELEMKTLAYFTIILLTGLRLITTLVRVWWSVMLGSTPAGAQRRVDRYFPAVIKISWTPILLRAFLMDLSAT